MNERNDRKVREKQSKTRKKIVVNEKNIVRRPTGKRTTAKTAINKRLIDIKVINVRIQVEQK